MNTPTPETDAKQKLKDMIGDEYVSTDFARRLERERDVAMQCHELCRIDRKRILTDKAALIEQRDKLADALIELRDAEWLTLPGRANDIVEAALAAWKEARSES